MAVATPKDPPLADHPDPEDSARLQDLEGLVLVAGALVEVSADVVVAAADLEEIALAEAVEGEVDSVAVAVEEDLAADEVESATSPMATVLPMAPLPVLEDHVKGVSEVDAAVMEIVIAIEEATADQVVAMGMTDEEAVGTTAAPAAPTTNLSVAETDRATEAGMVGMAGMMVRESVGTKATATTIHDNEGGIRARSAARVCFCKGLSRLPPFFRLNISRLGG